MTQLEQIIKLSELGYSKDEITALMGAPAPAAPAEPTPTVTAQENSTTDFLEALKLLGQQMAKPEPAPAPATEPTPEPVKTEIPHTSPSISLTAEDLVKLTQGIAVQTAAGSIETPKSANDIILGMLDAYESTVKKEE